MPTTSRSPAVPRARTRAASSPPRSMAGAGAAAPAEGGAGRQLARRHRHPQLSWPAAARPKVSHVILAARRTTACGPAPALPAQQRVQRAGPLLTRLNAPGRRRRRDHAGAEVADHPLRQQRQVRPADGAWIGAGHADHVTFAGPALKGAQNVVMRASTTARRRSARWPSPRCGASSPARAPGPPRAPCPRRACTPGRHAHRRSGRQPAAGRRHRRGLRHRSVHRRTARRGAAPADGRRRRPRGPLITTSKTALEFVVTAPGHAITHVYRAPFARLVGNWCNCAPRASPSTTATRRRW